MSNQAFAVSSQMTEHYRNICIILFAPSPSFEVWTLYKTFCLEC